MNNSAPPAQFKALRSIETGDRKFIRQLIHLSIDDLPRNEVLIQVAYSSLNYKDALSATGHKGVTHNYPHTAGCDAAGIVIETQNEHFAIGEKVIVTGYDLGMNTDGGFAEYICVPVDWVVKLPINLSLEQSMIYGTAGYTAALSIYKLLQNSLTPEQGKVLVTGSTGGVGSVAVSILAKLGYDVVAMTGKADKANFLKQLGAAEIVGRDALQTTPKPLLKPQWAAVLDTVGGESLITALKSVQYGGSVTTCGTVSGTHLDTQVFPFILRGINLLGIASAESDYKLRLKLWDLLANDWKIEHWDTLATHCNLEQLNDIYIDNILRGEISGRVLVEINTSIA
ncbi:YhdH/YhfP family quinone oxidoreductase [Candidatus Albibeggiatoa sp. nov. NOAA]|uniref:YhdH/YhfP family quinone oxidoreductase n=1 Tax=Candidatus Albibeggiatoa sp. nov. NOAA TaxID=3162724 RepID=UPI0032FF0DBE|nr:YhdH/YhfP family quinone oxidoreductase [Thiotrichaceae bacterium]